MAESEPSEDMNRTMRELLARRREEAPQLQWPAEESTKDNDDQEDEDARD